jgi:hypothetical protein
MIVELPLAQASDTLDLVYTNLTAPIAQRIPARISYSAGQY